MSRIGVWRALWVGVASLILGTLAFACGQPEQISAVQTLDRHSERIRIACLDVNGDGRVDASDADVPRKLTDITGDGKVDDHDLSVIRQVDLTLPGGTPRDCGGSKGTDWQVGPPAQVDCAAGKGGYIIYGVGGGAVDLQNDTNAAGVRWMLVKLGNALRDKGVPYQLISMAPGLNGTQNPQPDSETWATTYLSQQLKDEPCLQLIMIGHSHGATSVTATASRLEQDGLTDQIVFSALIDRVTALYAGDTDSFPQSSPVFNIYLSNWEQFKGNEFDQSSVENWDATDQQAPEHGEQGGKLKPVTHTTIDNSPAVLDKIRALVLALPAVKNARR